jgi:galacturonosyltransferase
MLCNHFVPLYNFRKEFIEQLLRDGYDVYVSLPPADENARLTEMGCTLIEAPPIDRRGANVLKDLKLWRFYRKIMKELGPAIVLSYTVKPNIYGCLASRKLGIPQICNITGLGDAFIKKSFVLVFLIALYKISVKKAAMVFFQNAGNRDYFLKHGMIGGNYQMLPGSGVCLQAHPFTAMPNDETVNFLYAARIMKSKGIDLYLQSAEAIREKYPHAVFYVAGFIEEEDYVPILDKYHRQGLIRYVGFQENIAEYIEICHCTVLTTYAFGEGMPNIVLETAAQGRACIASRLSATVEAVEDGVTGFLFKAGDTEDLLKKITLFMELPYDRKAKMGMTARKKMEKEFDREFVIKKYYEVMEDIL